MKCTICSNLCSETIKHKLLGHQIYSCDKCNYQFVDTTQIAKQQIAKEQKRGTFGLNFERNELYSNLLERVKKETKTILEIGTPQNYDLLKRIHNKYGDTFKLYSYDLFKPDLPEYITFIDNIYETKEEKFDLLLCIHTLEHIPIQELMDFVNISEKISIKYVFETPLCETTEHVERSSQQPHYNFFSELSLTKLFKESETYTKKKGNTVLITNIKQFINSGVQNSEN